jgi:hypothetical protein
MVKTKVSKVTVRKIFRSFSSNFDRAVALSEVYGVKLGTTGALVSRHRSVEQRITIVTNFLRNLLS